MLDDQIIDSLQGGVLFYPCSGDDIQKPIETFAQSIDVFWFADIAYLRHGPRRYRRLIESRSLRFVSEETREVPKTVHEDWDDVQQEKFPWLEPNLIEQTYLHTPTGRRIIVNLRGGYALAAFQKHIDKLSVFFYRGDGRGEGGSSMQWLKGTKTGKGHFTEVLQRIIHQGLIVTDGSNCTKVKNNEYRHFARFHLSKEGQWSEQAVIEPFADQHGNRFKCVGSLDRRKGPTLVWQVDRSG